MGSPVYSAHDSYSLDHNDNSQHLHCVQYAPGTVLSVLYMLTIDFKANLW